MQIGSSSSQVVKRSTDGAATPETNTADTATSSDFKAFFQTELGKSGSDTTNEEALFSSLVHHGVKTRKDTSDEGAALSKFEERRDKHARILQNKVGYASDEKAAKFALRDLVRNKLISKEEATEIYSKSFSAAQLDSDSNVLSDGVGGSNEVVISTADAISTLETKMAALNSSTTTLSLRNLGESSTGSISAGDFATAAAGAVSAAGIGTGSSPLDGPSGFLFKPISDTQGKLVVLAPESLTGKVSGMVIRDSSGNVIESGKSGGVGNGGREHFRFAKPGGSYPGNLTVSIQLNGGGEQNYTIPDPSQRYD